MKLNLLYGYGDYISGHINIDPLNNKNPKIINADWRNLDEIVDDSEATEIIALDGLIEYISRDEIDDIMDHWVSKLRHGGKMVVGFTDIYEVAKEFVSFNIGVTVFNQATHGNGERVKKCSFTTFGFAEYMKIKHGMKILKKRISGFDSIVEVQRL